MRQTWRWFGPKDLVSIDDMMQAGVQGVVSALHHVPTGAVWSPKEIARRQGEIARMTDGAPSGLEWEVVESLPVSEDIKTRTGAFRERIADYKRSVRAVARAGVKTVCYNFMAVTDWTRTDLNWRLPTGGTALRFDWTDLAAYDLFVLRRPGAEADHPPERRAAAEARFRAMSEGDVAALEGVLIDWSLERPVESPGLPVDLLSREQVVEELQRRKRREAMDAGYEAQLILRLADQTPDDADPPAAGPEKALSRNAGSAEIIADDRICFRVVRLSIDQNPPYAVGHALIDDRRGWRAGR